MVLGFRRHFPDGTPTHFLEKIIAGVDPLGFVAEAKKIHSIRAGNRWREGMSIQMAYGVRTKSYLQFNQHHKQLQTVVSVQSIEMDLDVDKGAFNVYVDGHKLKTTDIRKLIKNDGLTLDQFIEWFFEETCSFSGQIIHWTDLKY